MNALFFQAEFFLLILFSFLIPAAIYLIMMIKHTISRMTVLLFGVTLLLLAGVDVVLLHHLANETHQTATLFTDKLFTSELSLALYLLPLISAGIGINIVSHVLITHLTEAERNFDRAQKENKEANKNRSA